ncbi:hypothetical protein [Dyadobacter sediminis]|uniref:hypothetical protein n=1 Tax=Dyadobacter sediminis TaxID=1493691 RepID=UPI00166DAD38|nr:hypothetical protein [Dyadobacter sediminis]GGB87783.1 hypothetical protein GCM10011325_14190 [Dyadobacter sediminis]
MNNEILIRLFEKKDRKRRKILYSFYQDYFELGLSSVFIAETINGDLGTPDLVTVDDIRYCRFYFHGKIKTASRIRTSMVIPARREEKTKASESRSEVQWSDPDELSTSQNQIIKSKFSK